MKKLVLCLISLMMMSTITGCQSNDDKKKEENNSTNESGVKVDESIVSWANRECSERCVNIKELVRM